MSDSVWPFVPEAGFTDTLEFLTEVMPTYTTEQRHKLRKEPRRILNHTFLLSDAQRDVAQLKARRFNQTSQFYVPLWCDQVQFASVGSADTTLTFDYQYYFDYNTSDKVILWNDWNDYIVRDVSDFDDTTVTLSSAVGSDLTNVTVMPLRAVQCYNTGFQFQEGPTGRTLASMEVTLKESDDTYGWFRYDLFDTDNLFDRDDIFEPILEKYNSVYVRSLEDNFRTQDLSRNIVRPVTIVDNGFGPIEVEQRFNYTKNRSSVEIFFQNLEDKAKTRDFVGYLSGRLKPFYLPSFRTDIVPIAGSYSGTSLSIEDTYGIASDYTGREIFIEFNDGTFGYNTIDSAVDATSEITLTLANSINFNTTDVKQIGFMVLSRADVDSIQFTYGLARSCRVRFNVIEVTE